MEVRRKGRSALINRFGEEAAVDIGVIMDVVSRDQHIKPYLLRAGLTKAYRNSAAGITQKRLYGSLDTCDPEKEEEEEETSLEEIACDVFSSTPESSGSESGEPTPLARFRDTDYFKAVQKLIQDCLPENSKCPTGQQLYAISKHFCEDIWMRVHLRSSLEVTPEAIKILHGLHPGMDVEECKRVLARGCLFGGHDTAVKCYRSR